MKEKWNWSLSVGFYPGVLFGTRAYEEAKQITYDTEDNLNIDYVLYVGIFDICLTFYYD